LARREQVLKAIEEKEKEKEKKHMLANQEIKEKHLALEMQELAAADALAAAEAAELADASGDPKAEKVQQPLMQVKIEEEEIEQLQELSSLRH